MSEQIRNTIVEGDGTVYHVYEQLERKNHIDVELQNVETGETRSIQIEK